MPPTTTSAGGGDRAGSVTLMGPVMRQSLMLASCLRCSMTASVYASPPPAPPRAAPPPLLVISPRVVVLNRVVPSSCSMVSGGSGPDCGSLGSTAARSVRSLARPGATPPTMVQRTGSAPNSATRTSTTHSSVATPGGSNVMLTTALPCAGTTPRSGSTLNAGLSLSTRMSYSNSMGTLHSILTRLVTRSPSATRPKSMRLGNLVSFITGYACSGTSRFSPSEWMRTQS
mmetsp:Transcript_21689/g.55221  ORF Transcript_21689/g.55221 Transcript_21689/m.55221 type:complete len:229 (-) Transcript_21689:542-1228(-)